MDIDSIQENLAGIVLKIKEKRVQRGFSHENMADELQISPSAYHKIERQETKLTVERLLQIRQILDISFAEIFDLKTENIYNQSIQDNGIGHQEIQNLYQDNQALRDKLVSALQDEVAFLRSQLSDKKE